MEWSLSENQERWTIQEKNERAAFSSFCFWLFIFLVGVKYNGLVITSL
jgi:hypothetical protein